MEPLKTYMKQRRSALSMTLEDPGPTAGEIEDIVRVGSRVPDHGKLAPWRFVVWPRGVRVAMHRDLVALLDSMEAVEDREKKRAGTDKLLHAPCVIAVVSQATEHPKIPVWEQQLSAGAACMNTLIAANASGFEAQWLTAWYIYEPRAREILQLAEGERIAGLIHIGTSTVPKSERPRPELADILSIREV